MISFPDLLVRLVNRLPQSTISIKEEVKGKEKENYRDTNKMEMT